MTYLTEAVRTPHGQDAVFAYRDGTTDLSAIGATNTLRGFTGNEYGLRERGSMEGWAIDIGAHVGSVAIALAIDNPGLRVIAVEALAENCALIRASVELNKLGNVEVVEAAATDVPRKRVGIAYNWKRGQSLDDEYVVHSRFIGGMIDDPSGDMAYPRGVSLTSLLKAHGIDRVRLLKIDCEGCEWAVLASPDIGRVDEIVGEFHFGGGIDAINDLLHITHEVTLLGGEDTIGIFRAVHR